MHDESCPEIHPTHTHTHTHTPTYTYIYDHADSENMLLRFYLVFKSLYIPMDSGIRYLDLKTVSACSISINIGSVIFLCWLRLKQNHLCDAILFDNESWEVCKFGNTFVYLCT